MNSLSDEIKRICHVVHQGDQRLVCFHPVKNVSMLIHYLSNVSEAGGELIVVQNYMLALVLIACHVGDLCLHFEGV